MITMMMPMMFLILISSILMLINIILSKKLFQDREKSSPFECGFDPISNNHMPFSVHFFLISLIFLIFDIEIALLIPLVFLMKFYNIYMIFTSIIFMLILIISLLIEYSEKSMDWKI